MMCHRSHQTSLACGEGCIHCETKRLTKETAHKDIQGSGDKGYQWDCANCYTLAKNSPADIRNSLHTIINALSAKFEVVNKIQLPKLNGELVHIKHMSENIAKQNTEILRKLSEAEKRNSRKTSFTIATVNGYRKRNLNFPTLGRWTLSNKRIKPSMSFECNHHTPIVSTERAVRYRVRRKSYTFLISKLFQAFNRRLQRRRHNNMSPRKRRL